MRFRKIKKDEFYIISRIHLQAFKGFFLTSLGINFLNTYYKSCLKSKECIAVCGVDEYDEIQGFAVGTTLSKGFYKRLLIQNFWKFFIRFVILLFTKPNSIIRLIRNLDKSGKAEDNGHYAELLSIGIATKYRGQGVGKKLIDAFEKDTLDKGCSRLVLTTDVSNNEEVTGFYTKKGYNIYYEFTTYPNRKMYKFIKDLK